MRRQRSLIAALLALLLLSAAAVAHGELSQSGNLRLSFSGSFSPTTLPRERLAPISIHVKGAISTTDGTTPPLLRDFEVSLNRNGRLTTVGLPACTSARLQSTTTQAALERCRPALVGRGSFALAVDFPNTTPAIAKGTMLAFNGVKQGKPVLLLHFYVTAPARVTLVFPLTISHRAKGQFGTVLRAHIPALGGGVGAVTQINLTIGRQYSYGGQRRSYISAACAAPSGFPGAIFALARGSFHFADGRTLETTLTRDCHVG